MIGARNFTGLWVLSGFVAALFVGIVEETPAAHVILFVLWGLIGAGVILIEEGLKFRDPLWLREFWSAFGFRVLVMSVLHLALTQTEYFPWWEFGGSGGDELVFWSGSEQLVAGWKGGVTYEAGIYSGALGWLYLIGFNRVLGRELGGESVFAARMVLCVAGALIVPHVHALARYFVNERSARIAAALVFWLPDYWFYSSTLMRDVLVSSVVVAVYYHLVAQIYGRFSLRRMLIALALNFGVLAYVRSEIVYVNTAVIFLVLMFSSIGRAALRYRVGAIILLMTLVVAGSFRQLPGAYLPGGAAAATLFLRAEFIERRSTVLVEGGAEEAAPDSFGLRLLQLPGYLRWPLATVFFVLNPVPPWVALHGGQNMFPLKAAVVTLAGFVWFGLAMFLPAGLHRLMRSQAGRTAWIWGTAAAFAVLLGFASGGNVRWRLMYMPFLLVIIGEGIANRSQERAVIDLTALGMAGGLALYSLLKYSS